MIKMFKTFLLMIIGTSFAFCQGGLIIRNDSTAHQEIVQPGKKIKYQLFSDSLLGYSDNWERDQVQEVTDSSLIFPSGEEVLLSDIKVLSFHSSFIEHWRTASIAILTIGTPSFLYGSVKGGLEGMERDNEDIVPIHTIGGGSMVIFGVIPCCVLPKKYYHSKGYRFTVQ